MKKNYDFSNAVKNPYAKKLKKTICINISESVIAYFKSLSEKMEPRFIPKPRKKRLLKHRFSLSKNLKCRLNRACVFCITKKHQLVV